MLKKILYMKSDIIYDSNKLNYLIWYNIKRKCKHQSKKDFNKSNKLNRQREDSWDGRSKKMIGYLLPKLLLVNRQQWNKLPPSLIMYLQTNLVKNSINLMSFIQKSGIHISLKTSEECFLILFPLTKWLKPLMVCWESVNGPRRTIGLVSLHFNKEKVLATCCSQKSSLYAWSSSKLRGYLVRFPLAFFISKIRAFTEYLPFLLFT